MHLFFIIVLQGLIPSIYSCKIHGADFGICTYRYLPSTYQDGVRNNLEAIEMANKNWANDTEGPCKYGEADHCMPFCGRYIANYYPPCVSNESRAKDRWVEEQVSSIIAERIEVEKTKTARKHFFKNKACQVSSVFFISNNLFSHFIK